MLKCKQDWFELVCVSIINHKFEICACNKAYPFRQFYNLSNFKVDSKVDFLNYYHVAKLMLCGVHYTELKVIGFALNIVTCKKIFLFNFFKTR